MFFAKMKFSLRLFCCVIAFLCALTSLSQNYVYQNFGIDDGLPSSEIYDLYQDKEGYIWFATDKGLSRYNGYEFLNFTIEDGLPENVVLKFFPQKNGQIWAATNDKDHLFYFNEVFDGFTNYEYNDTVERYIDAVSNIKSIYFDSNNNLHLGISSASDEMIISKNGNLLKIGQDTKIDDDLFLVVEDSLFPQMHFSLNFKRDTSNPFSFEINKTSSTNIGSLYQNYGKTLVVMSSWVKLFSENEEPRKISGNFEALEIKKITENAFFVGYRKHGAKIYNNKGDILEEFLEGHYVSNFLIDKNGGYWFSTTDNGAYYIENVKIKSIPYSPLDNKLSVKSLSKGPEDELLISLKDGYIFSLLKGRFELMKSALRSHAAQVEYNHFSGEYGLYSSHFFSIQNKSSSYNYPIFVRKISEPQDSSFLIVSSSKVRHIERGMLTDFRLPFNCYDACWYKGELLVSTVNGLKIKSQNDFRRFSSDPRFNFRSDDLDIAGEKLFVATQGAGVVILQDDTLISLTKENGLSSNEINEVYVENESILWACSNSGLNKINLNTFEIDVIDISQGLISNEVNDVVVINDTVWVGTSKGLCSFPNKESSYNLNYWIYLSLNDVLVNNESFNLQHENSLSYDDNKIDFIIQGMSFSRIKPIYKYRLLGSQDVSWNETVNRKISYQLLPPGEYTFEVYASVGGQINKKERILLNFCINKPFWSTWWFLLTVSLIILLLIYLFFKMKVLSYNRDVTRELIRLLIKRLKRKEKILTIKSSGKEVKIVTHKILYVKSFGNYLDIVTSEGKYTIRAKISEFIDLTPDPLEYLRIQKSYIIRIDQVSSKRRDLVEIQDHQIPVGPKYIKQLEKLHF